MGFYLISLLLFHVGLLPENLFSDSTIYIFITLISIIQGGFIGLNNKTSLFVIPTLIFIVHVCLIGIILFSSDDMLRGMDYEVLWLSSYIFCPFMFFLTPFGDALVRYDCLGPITVRHMIWCFQYTFFIWLYLVGVLICVKRICIWLFDFHQLRKR